MINIAQIQRQIQWQTHRKTLHEMYFSNPKDSSILSMMDTSHWSPYRHPSSRNDALRISDICGFWYTTTLSRPEKVRQKVRKFAKNWPKQAKIGQNFAFSMQKSTSAWKTIGCDSFDYFSVMPLGPCSTHLMSHAQNTWLVLQGQVYYHFGILLSISNDFGGRPSERGKEQLKNIMASQLKKTKTLDIFAGGGPCVHHE